jgi:hypothetical protein
MKTIKFFGGSLGDTIAYYRCNLTDASSPIEYWDYGLERWIGTQYHSTNARHRTDGMIELCNQLIAWELGIDLDDLECEHEVVESLGFEIHEGKYSDSCESFADAVEMIDGLFESNEAIRQAIESVEKPFSGDESDLQAYADDIREAVLNAVNSDAFKVTVSNLTHPI